MRDSLDNLTKNLSDHPHLSKFYPDQPLLLKKGVYPYEFTDSFEKYSNTSLPPIEDFYSKLQRSNISQEEYNHAQEVWKHFNIKTLGEYADLYQITDVLHLADIFESFRTLCNQEYKLDPCHYYTAAGFSWDAMLKFTKIKLDYITDQNVLEFFEKQIRGGLCTAMHRYAEANNPYLPNHNKALPNTYLSYVDANNLYGYAMSQKLPTGNFKWLNKQEISNF